MTTAANSKPNGGERAMQTPPVVSAQAWEAARQQLLVKEKAHTHARDALAAERRRMPWMAVEKDYVFDGPAGKINLCGLFDQMGGTWNYLDITPLGRQELWEDSPEGYPQTPTYKWWNWHDSYVDGAAPDKKWVEISTAGEAAFRNGAGNENKNEAKPS